MTTVEIRSERMTYERFDESVSYFRDLLVAELHHDVRRPGPPQAPPGRDGHHR